MNKLFTIGFTKKNAKQFFNKLKDNNIILLIDIRLNNQSQLAGFTKEDDLKYFLDVICKIKYIHDTQLSPTKEILDNYKKKIIDWTTYEIFFSELLEKRQIYTHYSLDILNNACLLCSESEPNFCHRRLVAEYFQKVFKDLAIVHL